MKSKSHVVCLALALGLSAAASAATYRLDNSGHISLGDEIVLRTTAFAKDWRGDGLVSVGYDAVDPRTGTARWQFKKGNEKYGRGTTTMLSLADGRTYVRMSVTLDKDFPTEGLVCTASITDRHLIGGTFENNRGTRGAFPAKFERLFVYEGSPNRLSIVLPGTGRKLEMDFSGWNHVQIQDDRKWGKTFSLRIRFGGGTLKAGSTCELSFCLGGEKTELAYAESYAIRADEDWIPLDYRKEIVPGSAADLSHFRFRDGPAGKHGWLKAKDGQFVFENRPDEPQRFWGANFCGESTCPSHADAERFVAFFERAGYNTMRIHHYERTLVKGSPDRTVPNPEALERFDYFFAKAKEHGIYTTTDLFVSRPVFWQDIGIDREGQIDMSLVKGLFLVHEPAFENWKAFARNLLTHVNPHTGLRYADDPAMPFIALVNEGCFAWSRGIFDLDPTRETWKKWLAERRAKDPEYCPKAPADCVGRSIDDRNSWEIGLRDFLSDMEGRFVIRACAYLRSLGVKALLTDWNCGWYPSMTTMTNTLDYVDTHYYVNHPSFLGERWSLPVRMGNVNPHDATREMGVGLSKIAYRSNKPYTISEWNFTAPNSCRGAVGLLGGGCAALLDWDAMWRFDYAGRGRDMDDGTTGLGYFAVLADPFMTATERAGVLLFRRRELKPITIKSADDCKFPIPTEKGTGRFTLVTDRTAGGFGLAGDRVKAGPFECRLGLSKATVWVSAVDDKPLVRSDRLLLTHLTDLKTDGIRFMDDTCTVLQAWGSNNLIVRRGTAEISLALDDPDAYDVWALETNGARRERIPARAENGKLAFSADVRNAQGEARYLYEIARRAKNAPPVTAAKGENSPSAPRTKAAPPRDASVKDVMSTPRLRDVRLRGRPAEKMNDLFRQRITGEFAQRNVFTEARRAFIDRDDDEKGHGGLWRGEFWGKLMLGAARVADYLQDPHVIGFIDEECHRMIDLQDDDGYLGSYRDKELVSITDPEKTKSVHGWYPVWNIWNRKYAMWGMLMAYHTTGDKTILESVERQMNQLIDMLHRRKLKLHDTGTMTMNGLPSMSLLKPIVMLYEATGNRKYLDFAAEMLPDWDRDDGQIPNFFRNARSPKPLNEWYPEPSKWAKSYEFLSCVDGLVEYYRATGDRRCLDTAIAIRNNLVRSDLNPFFGVGYGDQLIGAPKYFNALNEVCDIIHWIRLNVDLFLTTGEKKYLDSVELAYFNGYLAGIWRGGAFGPFFLRGHGRHTEQRGQCGYAYNHCCVNNLPRTFMDVASVAVTRDRAGTFHVNLYQDATVRLNGVRFEITGNYPVDRVVTVKVSDPQAKVEFRKPDWCPNLSIRTSRTSQTSQTHLLTFDMNPRVVDRLDTVAALNVKDENVWAYRRYPDQRGNTDCSAGYRTSPAAQVMWGPLVLAKSRMAGNSKAEIDESHTVNGKGYAVRATPLKSEDATWGLWKLELTKPGERAVTVRACDFGSGTDVPCGGPFFSIWF